MTASRTVLILDADSALGPALTSELLYAGYHVIAHTRVEFETTFGSGVRHVSATHASPHIADWNAAHGPIKHVVFGVCDCSEMAYDLEGEIEAFNGELENTLGDFLSELQAAAQLLARSDGGQIWVLTQEDSMQYYLRMSSAPITTRARHSAVKSVAKEVLRLGVRVNCATLQLLYEQVEPSDWREARERLKVFAMKFKPVQAAAVSRTLRAWLDQDDLPLAGMVVPLGIGFPEANI